MFSGVVREIKERLDIVEVVSEYVKLKKMGANYGALCPFHSEKTPSFFVSRQKQIWHCFGACSEGGDIFKFVMKIEGLEFGDALRLLAKKAGVRLKVQDPKLASQRKRLYAITELACKFYEKHLQETEEGKKVKEYLLARGLTQESIKKWRLGFAPKEWRKLAHFLISRGFTPQEIAQAGLLILTQDDTKANNYFDRFRNRIIFPVFDLNSQVIGFGARRLENSGDDQPKYINTPNTLLYDKSQVLYGLDKAKVALRQKDQCILVEGYTDAIMVAQAGFENVVAVSGTALTESHLKLLSRYTKNLLLAFDMDPAGDSATARGIDLAQAKGFNLKVILMPRSQDPAELIKENPTAFREAIEKSKDIIEFYFDTTFANIKEPQKLSPQEKVQISEKLLQVISKIPNTLLQDEWLSKLAQKLRVREEALRKELQKVTSFLSQSSKSFQPLSSESLENRTFKKTRLELLKERVLALAIKNFITGDREVVEQITPEILSSFSKDFQNLIGRLKSLMQNYKGQIEESEFLKNFKDEELEFLKHLLFQIEVQEIQNTKEEFLKAKRELEKVLIKEKLAEISLELKLAEENQDLPKVQELLEKFTKLSQKLN